MSETRWTPEPTTSKCRTCGSLGFMSSPLGMGRCSYCDGTEGGNAPTIGDCADRIAELEAKLAKAVEVERERCAKVAESVALPMDGKIAKAQAGYMRGIIAHHIREGGK